MNFGQILREILVKKDLSQAQAAELLGIRQPSLAYYLTVKNPPKYTMLVKMSEAFEVTIDELTVKPAGVVVRETPAASQISDLQSQIAALRAENRVLKKRLAVISKAANP